MNDDTVTEVDLYRDVALAGVRRVYQEFRVAAVAILSAFTAGTTRTTAQIATRFRGTDGKVYEERPLSDVPVILPRAGGYGMHMDVRDGDLGVLVVCDAPVAGTFEDGGMFTPSGTDMHHYGCAVAFPGGRPSATNAPTPPPNAAGTCWMGAEDGSATIKFSGAGIASPAEAGTVVVAAAGPTASVCLGGDAAALGVGRLTDPVARNMLMTTWMSQVTTFINGLAPGSVTPFVTTEIGIISGASTKVVSE